MRSVRIAWHSLVACTIALVALHASLGAQAPSGAGATLFEGARLIVGDNSAPIERSAFVVQGNRIISRRQGGRDSGARRRHAEST